jgi:hypothetical protein
MIFLNTLTKVRSKMPVTIRSKSAVTQSVPTQSVTKSVPTQSVTKSVPKTPAKTVKTAAPAKSVKITPAKTEPKPEPKRRWTVSDYKDWIWRGCPTEKVISIDFSAGLVHCKIVPETVNLQIKTLYLSNNHLETVPDVVWTLTTLKALYLSSYCLTNISTEITGLVNLDVSNNLISSIPVELGRLNLKNLSVIANNLQTIPAEIGNIQTLEYLFVARNPIEFLPPNVRNILLGQFQPQHVYDDTQSVHNSTIQKSVKESITRIISIKPTLNSASAIT